MAMRARTHIVFALLAAIVLPELIPVDIPVREVEGVNLYGRIAGFPARRSWAKPHNGRTEISRALVSGSVIMCEKSNRVAMLSCASGKRRKVRYSESDTSQTLFRSTSGFVRIISTPFSGARAT